jgi:hypothetical protein
MSNQEYVPVRLTFKQWEDRHSEIMKWEEREEQEKIGRRFFWQRGLDTYIATKDWSIHAMLGNAVKRLEQNQIQIEIVPGKFKGKQNMVIDAKENPDLGIKLWGCIDCLARYFNILLFRFKNSFPVYINPEVRNVRH